MMNRLNTKQSRIDSRNYQFKSMEEKGWKRETYKGVEFFTEERGGKFYLKAFWGTSANHMYYYSYRTEEQRSERVKETKDSWDRHEVRKANEPKRKTMAAACAAAIRAELRELFPGIKFSVTSSNFSMGDSVYVRWDDGPTTKEVDSVIGKYQYGHFDGMTDMYENTNSRDDIPQSKYVHSGRGQSDHTKSLLPKMESIMFKIDSDRWDDRPEQVFYRVFAKTSFPPGSTLVDIVRNDTTASGSYEDFFQLVFSLPEGSQVKTESPQLDYVATDTGEIKIIEYGKGIAVIGDTKPIKDKLGKNGLRGIFQPKLSCGPGWIFPTSRLKEVEEMLQSLTS